MVRSFLRNGRKQHGTSSSQKRHDQAIAPDHSNAISTVEVIQALIALDREIRVARARGEAEGLTTDELAFYDDLADNDSAVQVMGNDQFKVIACELLKSLQSKVTIDWARREPARAKLRNLIKRILKKYGYPLTCGTPQFKGFYTKLRLCRRSGPVRNSKMRASRGTAGRQVTSPK